jgi:1,4-dihydroxy-2-naphthoate octaprenyltransferase
MKNFILAARPKTLLAGIIPPTVAYIYFASTKGFTSWGYFPLCFFGALFIQLATNFFNDVIDHEKGADKKRVGPTRVSAAGLVDIKTVRFWAWSCVSVAAVCGIPIVLRGGWPFVILGLISLYLTYGYTGGKVSLAYRGLGEIFVFLFFGLFSVMGSYYLYSLHLDLKIFLVACMFGSLATTFIGINNLRDRESDAEVGKRTLATKLKPEQYQAFILTTIFVPYLLTPFVLKWSGVLFMALPLLPAIKLTRITFRNKGAALNEGLKFSGIHLILFSLSFCTAMIYGHLL